MIATPVVAGTLPYGQLSSMSLLMRDLPQVPLLTAEQEQALAHRIRGVDVLVPPPGKRRPSVQEALDRLVEQNILLVVSIARGYRGRGLGLEDLVQEGALALRHAAERFDPDRGNRFATYAIWWVREAMVRATQESRTVSLPEKVRARVGKIMRAEHDLRGQLGRNPTAAEIGEQLGLGAKQVEHAWQIASQPTSLDSSDGEDTRPLVDSLAGSELSPEDEVERRALCAEVHCALADLAPEERQVLALRFGIGHQRAHSPQEIAELIGLSRHRAQRLEMQALARLRASHATRLRSYI